MPDGSNSGRNLPSDIECTRRQALAGLGAAGVLGVGGLSTALDGTLPDDERSQLWMAQRRRKFAKPTYLVIDPDELPDRDEAIRKWLWDTPSRTHDVLTSLEYLGASWEPYGNPDPSSGGEGAWQHSFVLTNFGMAQTVPRSHRFGERSTARVTEFPVEYEADYGYSNVPTLRVRATENQEQLAVSPVRDRNTFGFFRPPTPEDGDYPQFAQRVAQNRNEYVANYGAAEYVLAANEELQEDFDAMVNVGKTLLGLHPVTAAAVGVVEGAYNVLEGVGELLDQPEQVDPDGLRFYEGFEQTYPGGDLAGPFCGGFVLFHVYAAPGQSGRIEVSADVAHQNVQTPPYLPAFDSSTTWTVEVDAAAAPSEDDIAAPEKHNARVVEHESTVELRDDDQSAQNELFEERTHGAMGEYQRDPKPAPSIVPEESNPDSPQNVADGTTMAFHAYDTAIVDSHVESYEWSVHYTSEADGPADQYVDRIPEEEYASGYGPEFSFQVDSPDDPTYTDVHRVYLTVTDEDGRSATAQYEFTQGQTAEPEFSIALDGEPVQYEQLEFTPSVTSTPTSVEAYQWELTNFPFEVPDTALPWTAGGENFVVTAPQAGAYTVELTVVDATGASATETRTVTVEEIDPAVEMYAPNGGQLKAGESIDFRVTYDGLPEVPREQITWEFPEETETGRWVTKTFSEDRVGETFSVTVTVDSDHAEPVSATREFEVVLDDDLAVELHGPEQMAAGVTEQVELDVLGGADHDLNYGFSGTDPVDSSQRTSDTRPVTVEETGPHEVEGQAFEIGDNRESASDAITIDVRPFLLSIDGPSSPKEDDSVTYHADVEGDASDATFEWEAFGTTDDGTSVTGTFEEPGDRTVSMTATTADGETLSASLDVSVRADSDLEVTLDGPDRLALGDTGQVEASVSGAEAELNYGFDGTDPVDSSQRDSPTRPVTVEEQTGPHEVEVTAFEIGDNNESASATHTIEVYDPDQDMSASLSAPDSLHVGETGTVRAEVSGAEADLNYGFSGTDSVNSGQRDSPTRPVTARATGTREVSVTATEIADNNESASASTTIDFLEPSVSIDGPRTPKEGDSVSYSASVAGDPADEHVSFEWDAFGSTDTGDSVHGTFSSGGSRTVELTATVYEETVTVTADVDVQADDDMTVSLSGPDRLALGETGQVEAHPSNYEGTLNYGFDGADDVNSGQRDSPTRPVTVHSTGSHTVEVTAFEIDDNGERASATHTIDVYDPDDDMSVSLSGPDELEVGETGTVRANVSGAEATVNYSFSNVDSVTSGARDDPYRDVTYDSSGTETVTVEAFETGDNRESATASTSIQVVDPPDPEVSIGTPTTEIACSGSYEVSASVSNVDAPVSYDWELDGSPIGSGQTVSFSVSTNGNKTLSVEIEDADGDTASASKEFYACASTGGY